MILIILQIGFTNRIDKKKKIFIIKKVCRVDQIPVMNCKLDRRCVNE